MIRLPVMPLVLKINSGSVKWRQMAKADSLISTPHGTGVKKECLKVGQHAPTDTYGKKLCLTRQWKAHLEEKCQFALLFCHLYPQQRNQAFFFFFFHDFCRGDNTAVFNCNAVFRSGTLVLLTYQLLLSFQTVKENTC